MKFRILSVVLAVLAASSVAISNANEIKLSERDARQTTETATKGVVYQINLRAFTPEGTLEAAKKRLPKLAELGVTIVYLCPFMTSDDDQRQEFWTPRQKQSGMNNPKNPYRIKDYYNVDPEYGTNDDLRAFVDEAHALNLKVFFDLVYLHCGPTAVFIKDHPDFVKRDKDGKVTNADWGFTALNFSSAELREYLLKNMEYWVRDYSCDGFRLDFGDGVPLDFWAEGRRRLDAIRPGLILFSEGTRPEDQLDVMDLNYSFWFFTALDSVMSGKRPASYIMDVANKVFAQRPRGTRFVYYFDNHDIANDDYSNRREKRWGDAANRMLLTLIFTLDGTPMIYNGQEIADESRHSIFGNAPVDWSKENSEEGKGRFEFLQNLIRLRKERPALTSNELVWIPELCGKRVLTFLRRSETETLFCVFNFSKEPSSVSCSPGPAFAGAEPIQEACAAGVVLGDRNLNVDLPPYGYAVVKLIPTSK